MPAAILFKSQERFSAFARKLSEYNIQTTVLDFEDQDWVHFDYKPFDIVIYYPAFKYSSNHPLALQEVYDNLKFIHQENPHLEMFPDPNAIRYYNDKYRQYLFLTKHGYPIPQTIPLLSPKSVEEAHRELGYPMVIKNRYGAGGGAVFKVNNRRELDKYYRLSTSDFFNLDSVKYFGQMLSQRIFYYHLIKAKRAVYPFLSQPLMAQKFVQIEKDLKTVVGAGQVVESHWRLQASDTMWKMNIDDGGIGVWSYVPDEALRLSVRLAQDLDVRWLNLDLIMSEGRFLITEFSPVWHHYAYQEKPTFEYKADYNLSVPLEIALDLERIIVESLIDAVNEKNNA